MTLAEAGLAGAVLSLVLAILLEWQAWLRRHVSRGALVCVACAVLAGLYCLLAAETGMRQLLLVATLAAWAASLCYELRSNQHPERQHKTSETRPDVGSPARFAPLRMTRGAAIIFTGAAPFLVVVFDRMPLRASSYSVVALLLILAGAFFKARALRAKSSSLAGNILVLYGLFAYACESPSGWLTLLAPLLLHKELKAAFQSSYAHLDTSNKAQTAT